MAGITAYGAYVPVWRLSREAISRAWGVASAGGERSVAGFDEDSITMSVEAAVDCLRGIKREEVDGLFFASTTSPYREKQGAALIAAAADLRTDIITSDFANSLRSGTLALRSALDTVKSGTASSVLVTAADSRLGYPQSGEEQSFGDGAAALLVGESNVACEIEGYLSVSNEMIDLWRTDKQKFVNSWESRFVITHGYNECMQAALSGIMKRHRLEPKDFASLALYGPDSKTCQSLARSLHFDPGSQMRDRLLEEVGNTGAGGALMSLVATLETARPNDRILFAGYGDGADAFILRVTDKIAGIQDSRGLRGFMESRRSLPNYEKYLLYRELVAQPEEIFNIDSASTILWRDRRWVLRGHGSKCRKCGTLAFPIERVCYKCRTRDDFDEVRLTDKNARVFTFSRDRLGGSSAEPSIVQTVAESEEGAARMYAIMTDCDPEEVNVGMQVEMTFRRIREARGFYNYYWKLRPLRKGVE